jgi:hypothetical protein
MVVRAPHGPSNSSSRLATFVGGFDLRAEHICAVGDDLGNVADLLANRRQIDGATRRTG